ncbi:hypothetical protein Q0812_09430 [Brevundimonas sp. 2R-24]|uniref:Uncharacterized protein n=1 Tax=Peiella sedimenti TaxID=3061083 RepID=A0ABT8SM63_9CAUL|nr:hypothetical protein [Caulobacteraceae bacterium XZ-24]
MSYICYVETETSPVPHLQALSADGLEAAREEAMRVARLHSRPKALHLYLGDERLESIQLEGLLAP